MKYNIKLPNRFARRWLIETPLKIFRMSVDLLKMLDNQISFTYNIKLLFVPLFGLSSLNGRIVSFFTRVFMIFLGSIPMFLASLLCIAAPIIWLYIPILILQKYSVLYTILYFLILYIIFVLKNLNTPDKKILQIKSQEDKIKTFRPQVRYILESGKGSSRILMEKLLAEKDIQYLMQKAELGEREVAEKFIKISDAKEIDLDSIVQESFSYAQENKSRYVEIEHLFLTAVEHVPNIDTILSVFNSRFEIIKKTAFWIVEEREKLSKVYFWQDDFVSPPPGGIGKGMLGRVTPQLDKVSVDITKQVRMGNVEDIVGREKEIKKIAEILDGDKNDILLIGESGVGKTSIVRGIAYKIMMGVEYKTLKNKRLVSIDSGALVSEDKESGNAADKLSKILEEIEASGDIILFIDEMQNLVTGMGEKGGYDSTALSVLENHIAKKRIRLIGATSMENFRKYIEPNEAITRLFQIINVEECSKDDTLKILKSIAGKIEKKHGVMVTYPALIACIDLSEKTIGNRVLPDKAIDILERTSTTIKNSTKYISSEEISKEISEMTKIPITAIGGNEAEKLLNIGNEMRKMVIGQEQAIKKIEIALQRARTGIRDERKPIAGFLFVGMTGVGKTETAKALARSYFGAEENMIRLDMSEYQQIDSMNRIVGSPDGNTAGTLTEKVRNKPFSLVLIDEIEKAHPNILMTFLQILDEGRLTDTAGNIAEFTNTIIIATSNVGTKSIQQVSEAGKGYEEMQKTVMIEVRNKFAPELLNRFTDIIVFNPLSKENLKEITKLMLDRVRKTVEEKGIEVNFKPELIEELIRRGYSLEWGARPLARVIEDSVESYLAIKILKKDINPGDRLLLGTEVFDI